MKMCINGVDVKVKLVKGPDGEADLKICRLGEDPAADGWFVATLRPDGRLSRSSSIPSEFGLDLDEYERVKIAEEWGPTDSPVSPPADPAKTKINVNGTPVELWVEAYGPEAALRAQVAGKPPANLIFFETDGSASLAGASMSDTFGLPFKTTGDKRLAIEGLAPNSNESLTNRLRKIADLLDE